MSNKLGNAKALRNRIHCSFLGGNKLYTAGYDNR